MSKLETAKKIAAELSIEGDLFEGAYGMINIRLADGEILSLGVVPAMIRGSLSYLVK